DDAHDPHDTRGARRGDRVAISARLAGLRLEPAPPGHQPPRFDPDANPVSHARRCGLYLRLSRVSRRSLTPGIQALWKSPDRPEWLPMHGGHPSQAAHVAVDLRRGPLDPAV